jgi:ADP-ribose pyrophosphatase
VLPTRSRPAYRGAFLSVDAETWPGIEGEQEIVRHRGAAGVLPILPSGDVLLVRQLRPAVRDVLTEIPAGILDVEGEDALSCAARELFEETGYRHTTIEFLGGCYTSAGFSDEYVHLFVARAADEPEGEPEPGITLVREPLDRMVAAARAGRVRDAKTALALLLAAEREQYGNG